MLHSVKKIILLSLTMLFLTGCGSLIKVERLNVQQGNVITAKEMQLIKKGMTKQQIIQKLGNPVLVNIFHPDQVIYVYSFQPGYGKLSEQYLLLYFKDNRLARYETNITMQGSQPHSSPLTPVPKPPTPLPKPTEE